jgi:hypothetical protein
LGTTLVQHDLIGVMSGRGDKNLQQVLVVKLYFNLDP